MQRPRDAVRLHPHRDRVRRALLGAQLFGERTDRDGEVVRFDHRLAQRQENLPRNNKKLSFSS